MSSNPHFAAGVLILHNLPRRASAPGGGYGESDAGVILEAQAVEDALRARGIATRRAGVRRLADVAAAVAAGAEEIVFNLVESLDGDAYDFCMVPAVCRALGRGVTGNDSACQALTLDKWVTKGVLGARGIPVPAAAVIPPGSGAAVVLPDGDLILKPLSSDASEGIHSESVVRMHERGRLDALVARIHADFGQPALAEQYVDGREFNVTVLEWGGELRCLPVAEILFLSFPEGKPHIVDYAAKWLESSFEYINTPRKVPADLPKAKADELAGWAVAVWRAARCSDYARVDFRLDEAGRPFVLEVNANPDISPDAGVAAALGAAGIPYGDFVEKMLRNALDRRARS
jgi:D-alanine-D-alanine ligase